MVIIHVFFFEREFLITNRIQELEAIYQSVKL